MSYPKIVELVNLLAIRTSSGALQWTQTEAAGVFQAAFPNYAVRLYEQFNSLEDELDMVIEVINENGDLVEKFTDPQLRNLMPDAFTVMGGIHDAARRQALGVDTALDALISDLRNR